MKKKICVKCGNLAALNNHGVCKECEQYDANKNNDIISLLRTISNSDNAIYREESRKLIRKYFK